ncbi:hypothetical protein HO133_006280 [Letharia lupina]|uniref:Uncharacterized protein n=1 Tax=Letharia lupina TaxID=560253 RepID=A0A8H6C6U0_9LECA|nr:uncharacterized protein HO133_006280 [Letharia lupina]KAF6217868.1 hypothetical protein HO133_006280 [Letharia lupina]
MEGEEEEEEEKDPACVSRDRMERKKLDLYPQQEGSSLVNLVAHVVRSLITRRDDAVFSSGQDQI